MNSLFRAFYLIVLRIFVLIILGSVTSNCFGQIAELGIDSSISFERSVQILTRFQDYNAPYQTDFENLIFSAILNPTDSNILRAENALDSAESFLEWRHQIMENFEEYEIFPVQPGTTIYRVWEFQLWSSVLSYRITTIKNTPDGAFLTKKWIKIDSTSKDLQDYVLDTVITRPVTNEEWKAIEDRINYVQFWSMQSDWPCKSFNTHHPDVYMIEGSIGDSTRMGCNLYNSVYSTLEEDFAIHEVFKLIMSLEY